MPVYKRVNKDFFKKWSAEMSYILGFFAADGYITVNRRGGQFWSIQIADQELLERIKITIESEHHIGVRPAKNNEKAQYRLQIGSIEMCDDLRRLGYDVRKTKSLAVPNVPEEFFPQFVRGYFDGDGNVWKGISHKGRGASNLTLSTMFTSCSVDFLRCLHGRLKAGGLMGGSIYTSKGNYSRLQFSVRDSLRLYDFMYNTSVPLPLGGLCLERKKKVFELYKELTK